MLEQIISFIAPHTCIHCGREGTLLCAEAIAKLPPITPVCQYCKRQTNNDLICDVCRQNGPVDYLSAVTTYDGIAKQLVAKLKFERAGAAAKNIAQAMLPIATSVGQVIIVHIPTAPVRVRSRGYDQSLQIAKNVAAGTTLPRASMLLRQGRHRQVGSSRYERQQHADAYQITPMTQCAAKRILLIDDVVTTGATITQAAHVLKQAGAQWVGALVFARS